MLHHNRLDLLSLALLTARAIRLIREAVGTGDEERKGAPIITNPQERLAVGRELLRLNQRSAAEACFRTVAECGTAPDSVRAEALYSWARSLRRARRHHEAADVWRRLASSRTVRAVLRAEAQEALAVHHEHRDRDLEKAHQWAKGALVSGVGARHRTAVTPSPGPAAPEDHRPEKAVRRPLPICPGRPALMGDRPAESRSSASGKHPTAIAPTPHSSGDGQGRLTGQVVLRLRFGRGLGFPRLARRNGLRAVLAG